MTATDLRHGSPIDRAHQALDQHEWAVAYDAFAAADAEGELSGADLEALAAAAWWTAHPNESVAALERAFAAYQREADELGAARAALKIADACLESTKTTLARAWLQRAARILEPLPQSDVHGYLELAYARRDLGSDWEGSVRHAEAALDIGTRFGDRDLQAFGLALQGTAVVAQGRVEEGLALIDEATVAAVSGDLTPMTTGIVYCITIGVCRDLADYQRAGDWTDAAQRWCERQAINGFPGICRVHRAEIMRLRGSWSEAEDEARRAAGELFAFGKAWFAGAGYYEIGEIRLRMGDLDAAEEAFAEAHQLGYEPLPGLAMLHLARKRLHAARAAITTALADAQDSLSRTRLLPARVEISLAAHDVTDAREAAEELREIAQTFDAPVRHAYAHLAFGAVLTFEGAAAEAIVELRRAIRHWNEADLPYETAVARRCLGIAHRSAGDEHSAELELKAARSGFERLGAAPDAVLCDELLRVGAAPDAGRRVTRTFMFTDIVGSTNLLEAMGDEAWEAVLAWHDDALRTLIERHGGQVVQTTGDGFFAAFEAASAAAECAVAIQRRLAEHRQEHGFAPQVRIGLHAAEATVLADDYAGLGVHTAARVGAAAGASEILATVETLTDVETARGEERDVTLKGLAMPIRVASVDWRPATAA